MGLPAVYSLVDLLQPGFHFFFRHFFRGEHDIKTTIDIPTGVICCKSLVSYQILTKSCSWEGVSKWYCPMMLFLKVKSMSL